MKEIIIIITILIAVLIINFSVISFLNNTSEEIIIELENIKQLILSNEKKEILISNSEEIINNWNELEDKWAVVIDHNTLNNITKQLITIKLRIEENVSIQSLEFIEQAIYNIEDVKENQKYNLKNIF